MPEQAKIFLVEDDPDLREVERAWIEGKGHEVVLEASSLKEALEKVSRAKEKRGLIKKERVNVAVLDGNLGTGPTDGPQIAEALREAIPEIKIVSFSGEPVEWGDVNPRKPDDISKLGKVIAEL
jgi:CheY-like chemotaxis protein